MIKLKKKWLDELESKTPAMKPEILNEPIPVLQNEQKSISFVDKILEFLSSHRKASICAVLSVIVIAIALVPVLSLLDKDSGGGGGSGVVGGVIFVDVNPRVMFLTDKNGNVTSLKSANEDADVILASADWANAAVGLPIGEAVKSFVEETARLGYLDLQGGAVKIASYGDSSERISSLARAGIESFLKSEGIYAAVAEVAIVAEMFDEYFGAENSASDISESLAALPYLYSERGISELSEERLAQKYENEVISGRLKDILGKKLSASMDLISGTAFSLLDISILNEQIRAHDDNPTLFGLGDYFAIVESGHEVSAELSELLSEMKKKLDALYSVHEIKIESTTDLVLALAKYEPISEGNIEDFLGGDFLDNIDEISEILSSAGVDTENISSLREIPTSASAFIEKYKTAVSDEYELLKDKHELEYNAEREAISNADYNAFISNIISEHGSLESYYEYISQK